jgi:hypothetical protein
LHYATILSVLRALSSLVEPCRPVEPGITGGDSSGLHYGEVRRCAMSLSAKLRRAPLRLVTGVFILDGGIKKLSGDASAATAIHGMATGTYPSLGSMEPKQFLKTLAIGEIGLGSVLLLPKFPTSVAGAALTGFSGALLNMWWRTPGMHEPGSPRPTQAGTAVAKDVWMLGIGLGLLLDAVFSREHAHHILPEAGSVPVLDKVGLSRT